MLKIHIYVCVCACVCEMYVCLSVFPYESLCVWLIVSIIHLMSVTGNARPGHQLLILKSTVGILMVSVHGPNSLGFVR